MSDFPIPKNEAQRIEKLKHFNILDTLSEKKYNDIVSLASIICKTPMALITLIDENRQWFKAKVGFEGSETSRETSFCQYGIMSDTLLEVSDSLTDPRFSQNPFVMGPPNVRFYAGAPLRTSDGFNLGTLCVIDTEPKILSSDQKKALEILANSVITMMELSIINNDLNTEKEKTKTLYSTLTQSEKKYRDIIEKAGDIFYTSSADGKFTYINSSVKRHLGYSPEDLIGKHFTAIIHPSWTSKISTFYLDQFKNKIPDTLCEFPVITADGKTVWVEQVVVLLMEETRINGFQCVVRNINERKTIENELIKSKDTFQKSFEKNPTPMIILSLETGIFTFVNEHFLTLLGYSKEEVIGHHHTQINFRNLKDPIQGDPIIQKLNSQGYLSNEETTMQAKDGRILDILYSTEIIDLNGERQALTSCHDISKLKKLETEIIKAKNIAEQSVRFQEQFLANMSHEIRTPMNGIIGMTNLLVDTPLNEEQSEFVDTIKQSSGNLLVIINDILDLSKINDGKIQFEQVDLNIHDIIHHVVKTMKHRAEENGLTLKYSVDKNINTFLTGDPVRLNQIITNLTANAIKFTKKGLVKISVKQVEDNNLSSLVQFTIEDTGIGIQNHKLSTIFESYTQATKETPFLYGGTGLGLTISKQLVELQGGTITVESEFGQGSTFTVTIPFKKSQEVLPVKQKVRDGIQNFNLSGIKILLVEDNIINQRVAYLTLTKWGALVDIADNGLIALDLTRQNNYNIILMDLQMPEMDGEEATQQIRLMEKPKNEIPIIAMTASALRGEREKCLEIGMNDYISKPFNQSELHAKITSLLPSGIPKINTPSSLDKLFDFSILNELSEGRKAFISEMIDLFIKNFPNDLQSLEKAVQNKKFSEIKMFSHKIRSTTNLFGIHKAEPMLVDMEEKARSEKDMDGITFLQNKLMPIAIQAIDEIKNEIKNYT